MPTRHVALVGPVLASVLAGPLLGAQDSERELVPSPEQLRVLSVPDLLARMPADPWLEGSRRRTLADVPKELQRRAESLLLSDADWVAVLTAADVIHRRPRWPAGEELGAWIRIPDWLPVARITVRAVDPDLGRVVVSEMYPMSCGNCEASRTAGQRLLDFDDLPSGTHGVDLEITIDQAPPRGFFLGGGETTEEEHQLWRGAFRLAVEAVSTFEEAMPAVSDAVTEAAVRRSLQTSWWRRGNETAAAPWSSRRAVRTRSTPSCAVSPSRSRSNSGGTEFRLPTCSCSHRMPGA